MAKSVITNEGRKAAAEARSIIENLLVAGEVEEVEVPDRNGQKVLAVRPVSK